MAKDSIEQVADLGEALNLVPVTTKYIMRYGALPVQWHLLPFSPRQFVGAPATLALNPILPDLLVDVDEDHPVACLVQPDLEEQRHIEHDEPRRGVGVGNL